MVMIPVVIPGLSSISSGLSEKFPAIVGEADDKPSSILIKSGMADFGDLNTDPPEIKLDEGQTLIDVITIDTINDKDGDAYKYFPNTENIALVLVLGVMQDQTFRIATPLWMDEKLPQIIKENYGFLLPSYEVAGLWPFVFETLKDPKGFLLGHADRGIQNKESFCYVNKKRRR